MGATSFLTWLSVSCALGKPLNEPRRGSWMDERESFVMLEVLDEGTGTNTIRRNSNKQPTRFLWLAI